tara:strand:- start:113 stop:634 length:522 start_codon:yes stop_codon:yes gene_type:complete
MSKKIFSLTLIFISFSCFNNKLKEIKNFNFENLNTNPNVSQVNSKFIEGISSKDFKAFLIKNNFKEIETKEFIFKEDDAYYKINVIGNGKIREIEFYTSSKNNLLEKASLFFKKAAKMPIPQVDTLRIKNWTETNLNVVNERLSQATILSNIHFLLEQISFDEYKYSIKKYTQ